MLPNLSLEKVRLLLHDLKAISIKANIRSEKEVTPAAQKVRLFSHVVKTNTNTQTRPPKQVMIDCSMQVL